MGLTLNENLTYIPDLEDRYAGLEIDLVKVRERVKDAQATLSERMATLAQLVSEMSFLEGLENGR